MVPSRWFSREGPFVGAHYALEIASVQLRRRAPCFFLGAYAKMEVPLGFSLALFKPTHHPVLPQAGETSPLMKSLKALPATAGPAYDDFVSEFGTHYVNSEMFGGYCNFTAELDAKALVDFTWDMKYSQSVLKISLSIMRVLKVWCM